MQTLKDAREDRGISKTAVAKYLGVARQTYSRYEKNPETMTIEQAKCVCDFLRCDMADIFLPNNVK